MLQSVTCYRLAGVVLRNETSLGTGELGLEATVHKSESVLEPSVFRHLLFYKYITTMPLFLLYWG